MEIKMELICPKCYKNISILKSLNKFCLVDGYAQCKDCHADLDYKNVIVKQISLDKKHFIPVLKEEDKDEIEFILSLLNDPDKV